MKGRVHELALRLTDAVTQLLEVITFKQASSANKALVQQEHACPCSGV